MHVVIIADVAYFIVRIPLLSCAGQAIRYHRFKYSKIVTILFLGFFEIQESIQEHFFSIFCSFCITIN